MLWEEVPTDVNVLNERYKEALHKIMSIAQRRDKECPEMMHRPEAMITYMWQVAGDALYGKPLPIGG